MADKNKAPKPIKPEKPAKIKPEKVKKERTKAEKPVKVKKEKPEKVKVETAKAVSRVDSQQAAATGKKPKKQRKKMSYEKKKGYVGLMFILPWLVGFLMFFLVPIITSIQFSLNDVAVLDNYNLTWNNFSNYKDMFASGAAFPQNLTASLLELIINVPIILVFSLFVAVLLNRKFIGRGIARAVFFLPVIVTTGVVMSAFNGTGAGDTNKVFSGDVSNGVLFSAFDAKDLLYDLGLNEQITGYMAMIADRIFDVIWNSGIQILLFLAALQSISPALYEACDVEGATAWEKFWLITFPSVSPIILVNIVYTIVDTFSNPSNPVLAQINNSINVSFNYGVAAAMSWVYFAIILLIIGLVFLLLKRFIFYSVD